MKMTAETDDRVILITGASRGIGKFLTEHYLAAGDHVIGCSRTPFEVDLAQERWAGFAVKVGPDPEYISSDDKPALRIDMDWCGIAAVATLIVDHSCMRLFHEGVAGWLRLSRAAAG